MTFAEAKDKVAQKKLSADGFPYTNWKHFEYDWQGLVRYNKAYEEAAELYAASVREEAITPVNHSELADAVRFHHDPHDDSPEKIAEHLLWKFDIRNKANADNEALKEAWLESGRDSPEADHLNNG